MGSWPLLVMLGATRGAILCRMDDGSPSRPALVAPKSMMRHHDPEAWRVCGRWSCLHFRALPRVLPRSPLMSWGQHEAPFEEGEARAAEHLALEEFQTRDLTLHRPLTPGQRDPSFDRVVIIAESFGKPLEGAPALLAARASQGSSSWSCCWRTSCAKSCARSMASATSACCARRWASAGFPPRHAVLHAVRPAKPPAAPSIGGGGARPRPAETAAIAAAEGPGPALGATVARNGRR